MAARGFMDESPDEKAGTFKTAGPRDLLTTTQFSGAMDDLNPTDFTALQPYLDPARVKRGLREKVLDDASGLFPGGLVLFKDNRNVCSWRHVAAVPSIHETYPHHSLVKPFFGLPITINHGQNKSIPALGGQGDAGVCCLRRCQSPPSPQATFQCWFACRPHFT